MATPEDADLSNVDTAALNVAFEKCMANGEVRLYLDSGLVEEGGLKVVTIHGVGRKTILDDSGYRALCDEDVARRAVCASLAAKMRSGVSNWYAIVWIIGWAIVALSALALVTLKLGTSQPRGFDVAVFGFIAIAFGGTLASAMVWGSIPRSILSIAGSVALIISFPVVLLIFKWEVRSVWGVPPLLVGWIGALLVGLVSQCPEVRRDSYSIVRGFGLPFNYLRDRWAMARARWNWRTSLPGYLLPHIRLTITKELNSKVTFLLVEQEAAGLQRARDPNYVIPTGSERRVWRRLDQMHGGTIALAGQRGAGKSTLLTRTLERRQPGAVDPPRISVLVPAPTEYEPKEFLSNLFQQVCETYLGTVGYKGHDTTLTHVVTSGERRRQIWDLARWLFVILSLLFLVIFVLVSLFRNMQSKVLLEGIVRGVGSAAQRVWELAGEDDRETRNLMILLGGFAVFMLIRKRKRPRRSHTLADSASQYLYRLRVSQTLTRGMTASAPLVKGGPTVGLTRTRAVSAVPFVFPELVSNLRGFLVKVAKAEAECGRSVMIGIDEVDRIGSAHQVEQFVRDVKTIFDVENCYFLITVADDVGALFAQRTLSGSNVFDSAFDDVIEIEPLRLDEARTLLQRRAAGITDRYVWLLHSLSGGFPRELIRLARRIVDLNREMFARRDLGQNTNADELKRRAPGVKELAVALVYDETVQIVRSVRRRLSSMNLNGRWLGAVQQMRSLVEQQSAGNGMSVTEQLTELAYWLQSRAPAATDGTKLTDADQIMGQLATYLYFAATILDVFSTNEFDKVDPQPPLIDGCGSFEYLAAARREIGVSPESSRQMLARFRAGWKHVDARDSVPTDESTNVTSA